MGRHAETTASARRPTVPILIAAAVVAVLLAGGLIRWLSSGGEDCQTRQTVAVVVAPELESVAGELLAEPIVLDGGVCAVAQVEAQEPLQTVGDLSALEADALPDVWVPDSSLWVARAGGASLEPVGSVATSPVVLGTSREAVEALGWADAAPGWGEALAGGQALAVPDLATSAEGLAALAAVRSALGGDEDADNAVVQAVLAAQRGSALSAADGLAAGRDGGEDAPLVPISEQEVYETNTGAEDSSLVAVYPSEGSPSLDVGRRTHRRTRGGVPRQRRLRTRRGRGRRDPVGGSHVARARSGRCPGAARPAVQSGVAVADPVGLRRLGVDGGPRRGRHPRHPGPGRGQGDAVPGAG
jgi:hypothetical protein